jgi:Dyp-type peroxidase family
VKAFPSIETEQSMARDLSLEPIFPVDDIQGDILVGLLKRHQHFMFFSITDVAKFRLFLKDVDLTSVADCLAQRAAIAALKKKGSDAVIPTPGLNIALTADGMKKLAVPQFPALPAAGLTTFENGMHAHEAKLKDPPASAWKILKPDHHLHGVMIVTGASHDEVVDIISLRLAPPGDNGWSLLHEEVGTVRPDPVRGHEHFGYADGVSQPGVRGRVDATTALTETMPGAEDSQGAKGQDLLWPGEFVFGYPSQDPDAASFEIALPAVDPPIPFMKNGAFMVFRRLAQQVPEFNASVKKAASSVAGTARADPTLLGAQLVGRWKSGAPLINAPLKDNLEMADGTPDVNAFEFGKDRFGLRCPWAAHVRKAYPRDDVPNDTSVDDSTPVGEATIAKAEAFTQAHRMLRRGISFGPEVTESEALAGKSAGGDLTRGLLFSCYVTSLEDQFEFVQESWCNADGFSQPGSGIDPIIGQSADALRPFLGAAPFTGNPAHKKSFELAGFVHLEGGGYFFAPSISQLRAV